MEVENAQILFKDFSGKSPFSGGRPSFCVVVDDKNVVDELLDSGWNIKYIEAADTYYLPVTVGNPSFISHIFKVQNIWNSRFIKEEDIPVLDIYDFVCTKIIIEPFIWLGNDGKRHIKAYLGGLEGYTCYDPDDIKKGEK